MAQLLPIIHHVYHILFRLMLFARWRHNFPRFIQNKLWHDVQNEETVIYAKFGKDLFNISTVIGRIKKWPRFFGL